MGQDDFYVTDGFQAHPIGDSSIRDFIYSQMNRTQINRIVGEVFDEYQMAIWLMPLGNKSYPEAAVVYDYTRDVFFGPIVFEDHDLTVPGHFVAPTGDTRTIDSLVGSIDSQTWKLGASSQGFGGARSASIMCPSRSKRRAPG